jgi:RHS repeat-associated protein
MSRTEWSLARCRLPRGERPRTLRANDLDRVFVRALLASLLLSGGAIARAQEEFDVGDRAISEEVALDEVISSDFDPDRDLVGPGLGEDRLPEALESHEAPAPESTAIALPVGGPRSAATPQALPLPSGEGSIRGMGESFEPSLTSGALSFALPIAIPAGRNGVTPSLSLGYSSGGGSSDVGFGWTLGVAAIARQTDRGLARYVDRPAYHAEEDHFVYAGSQELVPIDSAAATALDGGTVPAELAGWQQYRAQVEGSFMRFFRAPDSTRWVVQGPDGTRHELGLLPASEAPPSIATASERSLVASPDGTRIASWALVRTTDPHGSTIHYVYAQDRGERYLSDVFYVSPAHCSAGTPEARRRCNTGFDEYAVRVRFVYESRPDPTTSYRSGWRIESARRLRRIEVTSAGTSGGARTLVHRMHFAYDPRSYQSLLRSITIEGRPHALDAASGAMIGDASIAESSLGDAIVGPTLPPMVFHYTGEAALAAGLDGFPGLDGTRRRGDFGPRDGAGDPRADLYDVNSDGLVDLVVTDPARFRTAGGGPAAGVYFNGFAGLDAHPSKAGTFSEPIAVAVPAALSDAMQLTNPNIAPMDVDGDGRSDLLHMPRAREYGFFTPVRAPGAEASPAAQGWRFVHLDVALDEGLDPRIDLSRDGERIRVLDVDADGLVDVVRTSGDAIQTWLNLGWHEGGEGRFGSVVRDGADVVLSTDPIESCLPAAGAPVSFDDPEIRLADMNGDGLEDIVRLSPGRVVYWPSLGHGRFGEDCAPGPARASPVEMIAPRDLGVAFDATYLADLDGDGASDLVQLGGDALSVWFNMGGNAFSRRTSVGGLPWRRDLDRVVRFTDIDGSGSVDVVFARARGWEWVDPMDGRRPRLLERVENGLGAETRFEYGTTSTDYLRDLGAAMACGAATCERFLWQGRDDGLCDQRASAAAAECVVRSSGTPSTSTVVRATETSDRLDVLGVAAQVSRTEYAYHDAYYEGIEQEHRGFGATDVRSVGGEGEGTSLTRSWMHQGRRPRSIVADRLAQNPWETLKGLVHLNESWDEATGVFLGATHSTFRIHRLMVGLDGREIAWAFASRTDRVLYDHTSYAAAAPGARVPFYGPGGGDLYPAVERYVISGGVAVADPSATGWSEPLPRRSASYHAVLASTVDRVDHAGHVLEQTSWGRVHGEWGEPLASPEEIVSHSEVALVDPAAWTWRPTESWTSGHGSTERLGWTTLEYAPGGVDPIRSIAHVAIPRAYHFATDADGSQAFTQTAEDIVAATAYDAWGSATATCVGASATTPLSACLRHSTVARDAAFDHLVVREAITTDGSGTALIWTGVFDRGLGSYLRSTDPRGAISEIGYDGFGRPTFARAPNVRGCEGSTVPLSRVTYALTTDPVLEPLSRMEATTFLDCHDSTRVSIARTYVDGLGRTRASLIRTDAPHAWTRTGLTELTPRGLVRRTRGAAFVDALEPSLAAILTPGTEEFAETGYDAFGRVRYMQPLGAIHSERTWTSYGALAVFECDPLDLRGPAVHVAGGTCSIARSDGQGRVEDTIVQQRREIGAPIETQRLWPTYRADGSLLGLDRVVTTDRAPRSTAVVTARVARTFAVDSQGRRIASTDRDTDARRAGTTVANRSWRYLWNRAGDLVAVRDPRGCGSNFYYDRAGRAIGEDYVGCGEAEPARDTSTVTVPAGSVALQPIGSARRVEVRDYFDGYPAWVAGDLAPPAWAASAAGLRTASVDRASRSVAGYDARGLESFVATQVALMPSAPLAPSTISAALPAAIPSSVGATPARAFDEDHTYAATATFDHAGRAIASTLPQDPDFGGAAPLVGGAIEYDRRGLPRSISISIDEIVYPILASATYERDGLMAEAVLGDDAGGTRAPTRSFATYDRRRRPDRMTTTRAPTASPGLDRPLGAVSVVMDQDLELDEVGNLLALDDERIAAEWPDGAQPQDVELAYDALYHVVGAEYSYPDVTDDATDYRDAMSALEAIDPMGQTPAPMIASDPTSRVMSLTWDFDFLGNTTEWTDDAHAFYERSLDRITNGASEAGGRPSALAIATDLPASSHPFGGSERGGWVEVDYGDSGNVSAVTVHGACRDTSAAAICFDAGGTIAARRTALRAGCRCDREQSYLYLYDELSQIVDARRYDRAGAGSWSLAAHLRYGYDGDQQRVVKEVRDASSAPRYAIWPLAGDFERRGLVAGLGRYDATATTETSYLVGGARIVWKNDDPITGLGRDHRITMPVGDLLGTTSAVIDLVSGELVEASTYYPNGARETLQTTELTDIPLEPAGFTTKEADEEVGLTYFGMRYLMPHLGRWATPDPLHIHAEGGGEAMNNYHYVRGNLLQARDPIGLEDLKPMEPCYVEGADPSPSSAVADSVKIREGPPRQRETVGTIGVTGYEIDGFPVEPGSIQFVDENGYKTIYDAQAARTYYSALTVQNNKAGGLATLSAGLSAISGSAPREIAMSSAVGGLADAWQLGPHQEPQMITRVNARSQPRGSSISGKAHGRMNDWERSPLPTKSGMFAARGRVDQSGIAWLVDTLRAADGGRITILSGSDASPRGLMGSATSGWFEGTSESFLNSDRVLFTDNGRSAEVRVLDITRMSHREVRDVLMSGDHVIVGVCYGANINLIGENYDRVMGQ